MMWRLQGSGAIFVCWVSVKLRFLFTAGPYWQVVSARCAVWIFIDLWNLRPQNACSLSFLRPALKICIKNADFCVNANPDIIIIIFFFLWLDTKEFNPYPSGLLHWHWGNHMIAPVSVKQPWRIWVNDSYESTRKCDITTRQTTC